MAPCHALGPFFRSLLAFGPSLRCSFFSSCLGIRILELWRETAIACICEFLQRKDKDVQEKIKFLRGICTLCKCRDTSLNLDAFCQEKQLAENVQALIDEEPKHTLSSEIKQEAMMSFANMSTVETALEGKTESILNSCFNSVFFLPPELSIPAKEKELYNETMRAMDIMLEALVQNCPNRRMSEELHSMFQALLHFLSSQDVHVRTRALRGVLQMIRNFMEKDWEGPEAYKPLIDFYFPILGELLGHLSLFNCGYESTRAPAVQALHRLHMFVKRQRRTGLSAEMENYVHLHEKPEGRKFSDNDFPTPKDCAELFGGYLRPAERMDVVLTALQALVDSSIYDKEAACSVMAVAMEDHAFWMPDKAQFMTFIRKNLRSITTKAARHCLDSLLLLLTSQMPTEEVRSLLKSSPPSDSNALDPWEVMLCMPQTLEKVLKEVTKGSQLSRLVEGVTEDTCILFLALMAKSEDNEDFFGDLRHLKTFLKHPSVEMHSVVLRGLVVLSETREKARKMRVVLPEIMATLQDASADIKMKALFVIQNIMGCVKRKEASSIAVQHAEKLLPLFVDESSAVQVSSIRLYRDMVQAVVWCHRSRMKGTVRRGLVPLHLRMHDENQDVAQAARGAIVQTARLLRWNDLLELAEKQETWRIAQCLLQRDQSRAEEYLQQSQPYLQDPQAAVRVEAVRFIGLAARYSRDLSEKQRQDIITALAPLARDAESSVQSLAVQTTLILRATTRTATSRRGLRALCCLFR
ncbi:uncharacterized protein LOC128090120 isoform X5 [Tympanuchus pallidicinctus]|uniref:uncharacterized protein LOC128090120 isoform X2 n=1 Tax=Tympanuchus pallidicinctus TaxID=109042 RepID=UPI0022875100|nr:uncharacterized protein LOC128090120 isoform X2 [Tympanuchus pallidicinctus]XP_052558137.1 uncharacterized protein LOC128090120 isoform X3 [Tympanuchus pallidicinctus]XP_052558138.1 uncharacterized protein LOC128090120 isoform X4 [Tympanuchus pallidicinctus]XP_052558139.1 uncharacterized protein LOC128090120 isoform X5 [Tympanuchus pallidicinctus]